MGDAGAEVEEGAEVAEDLAPEVEVESIAMRWMGVFWGVVMVVMRSALGAIAYPPAEDSCCAYHQDGNEVGECGLEFGCWSRVFDGWCVGGFVGVYQRGDRR